MSVSDSETPLKATFRIKLNELGWVEGRNLKIERPNHVWAADISVPQEAA